MKIISHLKNLFYFRTARGRESPISLHFNRFQSILRWNNEILELIADMGDKLGGNYVFDRQYLSSICQRLNDLVYKIIYDLNMLTSQKYMRLYRAFERIQAQIQTDITGSHTVSERGYTLPYHSITRDDLAAVGGKNAILEELKNVLELRTPDGFAITTRAFHDFMIHNDLLKSVQNIIKKRQKDKHVFVTLAQNFRKKILQAELPLSIAREIRSAILQLKVKHKQTSLSFAVRSSAVEEDTEHSFAGQYESFLNVPEDQVLDYYKKVIASAYSLPAWEYRIEKGFQEHEIAMAVGCQLMIRPVSSGVLYTMDPIAPEKEVMTVAATWGLGKPVMEGETKADQYFISRDGPYTVQFAKIVRKEKMLIPDVSGGTMFKEVPYDLSQKPTLSASQLEELAHTALLIERYYKRPQDIEWEFDEDGKLVILQARPLRVQFASQDGYCELPEITKEHSIIFSGKGEVAQRGIGYGKVFVIYQDEDIDNCPYGAILVAHQTSPRLTRVIRKVVGILTDVGSSTGHMATVAREFRIPTIVNTDIATKVLKTGDEVTVDASQHIVYAGIIKELCYYERTQEEVFEESYEYRLLRRMLKKISPLNLVDPHDESFRIENCQTYHDIVRFVHEKAVEELMLLSEKYSRKSRSGLIRLEIGMPLGLYVLDIGNGIDVSREDTALGTEQIASRPMKAFLTGLVDSGLWATDPVPMDLGSFMSSVTRTFSSSMAHPEQVGRNLVVLSDAYMNINLRLGYHFNIIDAYIGENINDNYAYFRFIGGVTDITRRSRRANFIAKILKKHDFRVEIRADLVIGRLKKLPQEQMTYKVALLGGLVAYTRQLDVLMNDDGHIRHYIDEFTGIWPVVEF